MDPRPLHGQHLLSRMLGRHICGLQRWVLDLRGANDEFGHGVTVVYLDNGSVTFRSGPNEDFIVVQEGAPNRAEFHPDHWTLVDLNRRGLWTLPDDDIGQIDVFIDGVDDVAVLLHMGVTKQLVFALVNTDFVVAPDLSVLEADPELVPKLRLTLRTPKGMPR